MRPICARKVLVQCGQGDGGCCRRLGGSAFPVLSALLSCSNPVVFMGLCATAYRRYNRDRAGADKVGTCLGKKLAKRHGRAGWLQIYCMHLRW